MLGRNPFYSKQKLGDDMFKKYYHHDYDIKRKATSEELSGQGLLSKILGKKDYIKMGFDIASGLVNKFPGEKHMPLYVRKDKKIKLANFAGPGTKVLQRIKGGPPLSVPITKVDEIAKAHDLRMMTAKSYEDVLKAHNTMLRALENAEKNKTDSLINIKVAKAGIKIAKFGEKTGLIKKDKWSNLKGVTQYDESDQKLILAELEKLQLKGLGIKDILKVLGRNKTILYIKNKIVPSIFSTLGIRNIHPDLIHQITHFVYKLSKKKNRISIPALAQKLAKTFLPLMIYSSHITHRAQLEGSGHTVDLSRYGHILFNPYREMSPQGVMYLQDSLSKGIKVLLNNLKKMKGGYNPGVDLFANVGYKGITGSGFWSSFKKSFYKFVHSKPVKVLSTIAVLASPILAPEIAIPAGLIKYLGEHMKRPK